MPVPVRAAVRCRWPVAATRGRAAGARWPATLAGNRWPWPVAGRCWRAGAGGANRRPVPVAVPVPVAILAANANNRPSVIHFKFGNPISDFVFNPEILARKQFGLGENGQTNFGNPF